MSVNIRKFVIGIAIASCMVGITGCSKEIKEEKPASIRPIKLVTIASYSNIETLRYPAVVNAGAIGNLSFQVPGLIASVPVLDAQKVEKGDIIAQLDQRDFVSQLASARARYRNAKDELQRANALKGNNAIAPNVLGQRETQYDIAKAQLDKAEKALQDTVIKAPFNGVVAQVSVKENQTVSAGQEVASIVDLNNLEVSINLPAQTIAESRGFENKGAYVILEIAPNKKIPAELKKLNLLADTASQTYIVTFSFTPPADTIILPGMNATMEVNNARLTDGSRPGKSIPLSAITDDGKAKYVWVVNQDTMKITKREVTIADGVGEYVLVTEGLQPGEVIAAAGANFLYEGMQVRPWSK